MGHGRPQWPVQILQQKDKSSGTYGKLQNFGKTKQSCLSLFESFSQSTALAPLGCTRLTCVGTLPCKAMGMVLAELLWLSKVGLPCSSPCINLASKPWLATLGAPITSLLQAGFGFGLCLALGLCFSCKLVLAAGALPFWGGHGLLASSLLAGLFMFLVLASFCIWLKASCSMDSRFFCSVALCSAWAGSLVVTCFVTDNSASTLGTNKALCGVAICLCVAKLWLEHWPGVANATQADLSCFASNSWSKSLVVFSPPLVLVELVACLSTWSFLLVDLQATLFIQAASGTCLVDGNSSPYTFCNHVAPISAGLLGYVLGPAIC